MLLPSGLGLTRRIIAKHNLMRIQREQIRLSYLYQCSKAYKSNREGVPQYSRAQAAQNFHWTRTNLLHLSFRPYRPFHTIDLLPSIHVEPYLDRVRVGSVKFQHGYK